MRKLRSYFRPQAYSSLVSTEKCQQARKIVITDIRGEFSKKEIGFLDHNIAVIVSLSDYRYVRHFLLGFPSVDQLACAKIALYAKRFRGRAISRN